MVFFHGPLRLSPHTSSGEGGDVPCWGDRRGDEGMWGGPCLGLEHRAELCATPREAVSSAGLPNPKIPTK